MRELPFSDRFRAYQPDPIMWLRSAAFVPQHYEPGYAYPLLVLFHGRGGDERQLLRLMPQLSNRNYVAVALRGPRLTRPRLDGSVGYSWAQATHGARGPEGMASADRPRIPALSEASCDYLADYVSDAVTAVQGRLNVHAGRIFLVGYGEGAAAAYRLGLGMPSRFAGIVAVNGYFPRVHGPLIWLPEARRLRVLIVHGKENRLVPLSAASQAHRLLVTAGIDTRLESLDAGHRISSQLLRLIDEWLMQFCNAAREPTPVA